MAPHHLIITTGTSLLGNLQREPGLSDAFAQRQTAAVVDFLNRQASPMERVCGAELNSSFQLLEQGQVQTQPTLHFCVSDTPEGQWIGEVLKAYCAPRVAHVAVYTIEGLQDSDPRRFGGEGLRNLVRLCGRIIQQAGGAYSVALNATGGYKAQIAIAALIGSALEIPVFYKHERFDSVIAFPPMPVAFDDALITQHLGYLLALEDPHACLEMPPEGNAEALMPLLEVIEESGEALYALSPLGQICLTGYLQRHPVKHHLPRPATEAERKPTSLRQDHFPIGFETFVHQMALDNDYIVQCRSLSYDKQRSIRHHYFYLRSDDPEVIVGEFVDKNNFGARYRINTTATTARERSAVIQDLFAKYGG